MDTRGQLLSFLISVAVGVFGGILYEPFHLLRVIFACDRGKNPWLAPILDVLFWISFAIVSIFAEYIFHFQGVRVYAWCGYCIGGILYLIFLHRILAFFERVCYNKIVKLANRIKKRDKTLTKRGKRRV